MKHFLVVLAFAALLLAPLTAQTRTKKKAPADFPTVLAAAGEAFKSGDFAQCTRSLKSALQLSSQQWSKAIRAALPAAPEGYTIQGEEQEDAQSDDAAGMAAMFGMGMGAGVMTERTYSGPDGRIQVSANADSPMIQMMSMMFNNPAMLGDNAEMIEYGDHKAILESDRGLNLQIMLHGKHLVTVDAPDNEELLFAMFDQAAIDRLAAVLGE